MGFFLLKRIIRVRCAFAVLIILFSAGQVTPASFAGQEERLLIEVLNEISREYHVYFTYDSDMIRGVTVDYEKQEGESVRTILTNVLSEVNLGYQIFEEKFVIIYREDKEGLESLQKMIRQMESIVSDRKAMIATRKSITVDFLRKNDLIGLQLKRLVREVSGRVTDGDGSPLVGVNILVKGTSRGTTTDFEGRFSLTDVDDQDILILSYIGYKSQEVSVSGRSNLEIVMMEDAQTLDEVVVVGYGVQKKSDLTGSVASIDINKTEVVPTTNLAEMLRGRASGLKVNLVDPRPGGTSDIMIRGRRSILGGNEPLFIVDGVPIDDINNINTEDIASIEVLKDASSQAIYGARASNGVILITTKRGEAGDVQVNYHAYYTNQRLTKNFELYSPEEFAQLRREAYRTTNGEYLDDETIFNEFERESLNQKRFVNWEDLILRNASLISHDISVSGGTEKSQFYTSARYFDQNGLIPTSGYKRGSFRLNFDQVLSDKINIRTDISLMTDKQNIESSSLDFITISPLAKAYNDDGTINKYPLGTTSTLINPLWNLNESVNQAKDNSFNINLVGEYQILKNLNYRLNTSLRRFNREHGIYMTSEHGTGQYTDGEASITNSLKEEYLVENILDYHLDFSENHELDVTAVQGINQIRNLNTLVTGTGYASDELGFDGLSGALNQRAQRYGFQRRLLSYMGRVRYQLFHRYLFTLTGRSDGSSVFAASKKRGFFPSAALGWKIHEENFLKYNQSIDELKLRVSYGAIGNEAIAPYQTLGITENYPYVFGGETASGFMPGNNLPNPNLTWETSTTFNLGLDFALFKNRITGGIEYYNTHTHDLLVDISLPGNTGYSSTVTNGGESRNNGIEGIIAADIIRRNHLQWSVTATVSANRNKILRTGLLDENGLPKDDIARNRFVGHPIEVLYQKKFDGIFQSVEEIENSAQKDQPNIVPGQIRVIDKNGDGVITDDDNFIFKTAPDWYGAVSTDLKYRNFDLMADFYVVEGATKLNPYLAVYENGGTLQGSLNGIKIPYYLPEEPSEKWPIPQSTTQSYLYSMAIQDASYIRLRTLTLGYTLPSSFLEKAKIRRSRLYITATNLITLTSYKSYSPEINPNSFPDAKALTFGFNIGF